MKKIIFILVLIIISCLIVSCSDGVTNPESKRMRIFARLTNRLNSYDGKVYSDGYIEVYYYPAVSQTTFILDGLNIYESDFNDRYYSGAMERWWYNENGFSDGVYHWVTNKSYKLKITANNNDYISTSNCELPGKFIINENSLPEEIDPQTSFVLNWSNCENETNFTLHYSISYHIVGGGEYESSEVDSLIILDSNTNIFTFTSDMLNIPNAYLISISLIAINGSAITPNMEGNFSGDGNGYFYGAFDPGFITIDYVESENTISNQVNRDKELKERANDLFKSYLGF